MDLKAARIFEVMVERNLIPASGTFDVTESLCKHSFDIFRELFPPKKTKLKKGEVRVAKKIAALNMMQLNEERASKLGKIVSKEKKFTQSCGFIYLVSNPAFPGFFKVGIARDIDKRLRAYQTCDPLRRYKIEHYKFVSNKRECEKSILDKYKIDLEVGEWIKSDESESIRKEYF